MQRLFKFSIAPILILMLLMLGLSDCGGKDGPVIQVTDVWARQSPKAATSGDAYMRIENNGNEADTLIKATARVSNAVEIHEMVVDENDVMHMKPIAEQRLVIPAKSTVEFKPDSYHIVFIGLLNQLREGDVIDLTLTFEKSGEIQIQAPVKRAGR